MRLHLPEEVLLLLHPEVTSVQVFGNDRSQVVCKIRRVRNLGSSNPAWKAHYVSETLDIFVCPLNFANFARMCFVVFVWSFWSNKNLEKQWSVAH